MNGRQHLAETARALKARHPELLRGPCSFSRPDVDRAFDALARRRAAGVAAAQTELDLSRPSEAAIAEAQAAYDRGEVTLLEATFLADVLDDLPPCA